MECSASLHLQSLARRAFDGFMRLVDYLEKADLSVEAFAAKIQVHPTTVYRILRGLPPSWETLRRIVAETQGRVTANDFLGELPEKEALSA